MISATASPPGRVRIDLTGAVLIAPDFNHCHPATARFDGASFFARGARFDGVVVAVPGAPHVWPEGWRVAVQPDGTARLEREASVGADSARALDFPPIRVKLGQTAG
ncbi:hypothetical protein [Streptosporangium sp. NPDC004631]